MDPSPALGSQGQLYKRRSVCGLPYVLVGLSNCRPPSRHQELCQAAGTPTVARSSHPRGLYICAWRLGMGRKGDRRGNDGGLKSRKSVDWDGTEWALLPIREGTLFVAKGDLNVGAE